VLELQRIGNLTKRNIDWKRVHNQQQDKPLNIRKRLKKATPIDEDEEGQDSVLNEIRLQNSDLTVLFDERKPHPLNVLATSLKWYFVPLSASSSSSSKSSPVMGDDDLAKLQRSPRHETMTSWDEYFSDMKSEKRSTQFQFIVTQDDLTTFLNTTASAQHEYPTLVFGPQMEKSVATLEEQATHQILVDSLESPFAALYSQITLSKHYNFNFSSECGDNDDREDDDDDDDKNDDVCVDGNHDDDVDGNGDIDMPANENEKTCKNKRKTRSYRHERSALVLSIGMSVCVLLNLRNIRACLQCTYARKYCG
jgi:hypothetical protein